uniref:Uncharacterized protein n=1 Tax=Mycena chlorophos TaxID=658473 RepID=A0ABQ0LLZ3_MYCCL|nr:predicted protein [Mycena chlorophos]
MSRSSGLDFSDRQPALDQHPDVSNVQGAALQRNKTERGRLQTLQRNNTVNPRKNEGPKTFREKIDLWMINEGQRHIFFVVFLFLHALVATLGFLHYFLKDNLVGARAEYGITYGPPFLYFLSLAPSS